MSAARSRALVLAGVAALVACADASLPGDQASAAAAFVGAPSLVIELDPPASAPIYAMSDLHGGYDRAAALLANNGLLRRPPASPDVAEWAAGTSILVVTGDLVDKGPQPIEVVEFLRALETSASAAGGQVIVLLGNHEAEFFVAPMNSKATAADGIDQELRVRGIRPADVASGVDPHGRWLRDRPLGARIGGWFFSHAGNTKGRSIATLTSALGAALAAHPDYDDPELVGADSILESRDWYAQAETVRANAAALGVGHFVFGHQPNALGPRGAIATAQSGRLFRIDCGMSPAVNDSTGCLLRVRRLDAQTEIAEAMDAHGSPPIELWRGPPAR
jgi:hypothetical protein